MNHLFHFLNILYHSHRVSPILPSTFYRKHYQVQWTFTDMRKQRKLLTSSLQFPFVRSAILTYQFDNCRDNSLNLDTTAAFSCAPKTLSQVFTNYFTILAVLLFRILWLLLTSNFTALQMWSSWAECLNGTYKIAQHLFQTV